MRAVCKAPGKEKSMSGNRSTLEIAREVFDIEIEGVTTLRNNLGKDFEILVDRCAAAINAGGKIVLPASANPATSAKKSPPHFPVSAIRLFSCTRSKHVTAIWDFCRKTI